MWAHPALRGKRAGEVASQRNVHTPPDDVMTAALMPTALMPRPLMPRSSMPATLKPATLMTDALMTLARGQARVPFDSDLGES